jgi:hypothetical protein
MTTDQILASIKPTVHRFRRISQTLSIKLLRAFNPLDRERPEKNSSELDAALLFKKMLVKADSELLISPLSGRYFLKNDRKQILIILTEYELVVINHVFGYNIKISQKLQRSLYQAFVNEVEQRRTAMENAFRQNVKHSLQSIISHIND